MKLGLPPSPSSDAARASAPALERALRDGGVDVSVEVAATYGALGDDLLARRLDLAWAPPIVCARVEMAGGRTALRAVRGGATSYRAGLVCRIGEEPDLTRPKELVAAWVDEDSAAGYLLARSWLAGRHIDAVHGFKRALFVGSYVSALQAVADRRADLASAFVSADNAPPHSTLDEIDDQLKAKLRIMATTGETQTDGVVIAPGVGDEIVGAAVHALAEMGKSPATLAVLRKLLACDELRRATARPTSNALRDLIAFNERERERR